MAEPPVHHHCKECGMFFDSGNSLEVHVNYHEENLLSKWGANSSVESNNNIKPSKSPRIMAAPADSSDSVSDSFPSNFNFAVHRSTPPNSYYPPTDMRPPSVGQEGSSRPNSNFNPNSDTDYMLGPGAVFSQRQSPAPASPSPHHALQSATPFRFHPYQKTQYTHHDQRNGAISVSSPSPSLISNQQTSHQCEKCGFICDSPTGLLEHIQNSHPPSPAGACSFSTDYMRHSGAKNMPQAEILDLDSHTVLYQPPQDEEANKNSQSSQLDPVMLPWMPELHEKRLYHPMNLNGSGMPSPDFNVSTTTLSSPEISHHQSYYNLGSPNQLAHQITSTQMPAMTQKPALQSLPKSAGNASWKSNEARRPKTYNCVSCNKWFTSSGHLKRHYNTTLHKNAVKQSGLPDPANGPVSNHHHPPKDHAPPYRDSPPAIQLEESHMPIKIDEANFNSAQAQLGNEGSSFLPNPPNSVAGPSELTGGLLLHSTQFQTNPGEMRLGQHITHIQQHQNFHPYPRVAHHTYPQDMVMYPNLQPPHVSSTQPTTSSITGNSDVLELNEDYQQIWGEKGELKSQLIALSTPTQKDSLPGFAHIRSGFFPPTMYENRQATISMSQPNVGGLAQAPSAGSFYSPQMGFEITNVNSLEQDTNIVRDGSPMSLSSKSCDSYSSPENALSSTVDDMEKCSSLEHVKVEEAVSSTSRGMSPPLIKCVDCDKVFNKACYLTQHNKSFHAGVRPYKCDKCGKRFEDESLRLEHLKKHAGEKPYKCDICPKQFNHKTDLRRHMCLHTGDKPFCCHICGKGFIRKDHMVKHCDTHKKKPVFATQVKSVFYQKQLDAESYHVPVPVNH